MLATASIPIRLSRHSGEAGQTPTLGTAAATLGSFQSLSIGTLLISQCGGIGFECGKASPDGVPDRADPQCVEGRTT